MDTANIFSKRALNLKPSPIRELFKYSADKEIISFGGGYPAPCTFPLEQVSLRTIYGQEISISKKEILAFLQYGPSQGDSSLLSSIAGWQLYKNNVKMDKSRFLILNGSQEGIFALGFLMIDDGDLIAVTEPTYPGTISAFNAFRPEYLSIPVTSNGIDLDFFREKIAELKGAGRKMPKFIYIIPNGHNPAGVTMDLKCRKALLEICSRFNICIIEDDPYELVRFHDNPVPTLQSLDTNELVIRLDSFSKILIPGLRIGYVSGPVPVIKMIELFKQASNLHTSSFAQGLLCAYLKSTGFDGFSGHIKKVAGYYSQKMEYTATLLDEHISPYADYERPDSGLFIWLTLKEKINAGRLLFDNISRHKVIAVPGSSFSTSGGLHNSLRLSFGTLDNEDIKNGILRLKTLLDTYSQ